MIGRRFRARLTHIWGKGRKMRQG
ncbi:MAG: hypothetical protein JWM32_3171, partial [Verrucomicrobia bacterium]|nr:hypothetical protein [Verrucomicrobiota bacterium]